MNGEAHSFLWLPTWSLWRREVVRFVRQRSRILGALATPIIFWLLLGSGLRNSVTTGAGPAAASLDYLEYSFAGTIVMILLFTAIFSTISIIEDRREGFLQGVIAAPVRRSAIVLGKIAGSTTLAVGQALVFMLLAPLAGVPVTVGSLLVVTIVLIVVGVGLSGLGVLIAWPMDSTQGFHAIMNVFLIPMWALSGALFPMQGASAWVQWTMTLNPLTYGVSAVRHALYISSGRTGGALPSMSVCLVVSTGFAVVMIALAARVVERRG